MQIRYGIVYKIENIVNHKVYIGITTKERGFKGRYCAKGEGIERVYNYSLSAKKQNTYYNKHLFHSIEKYGFDSFKVIEEFDVAYSKEELSQKERYWINFYKSYDGCFGYNVTAGGEQNVENIRLLVTRLAPLVRMAFFYNEDIYSCSLGDILNKYCKGKKKKQKDKELREAWWYREKNFHYTCPICGRIVIKQFKKNLTNEPCIWCKQEPFVLKCYKQDNLKEFIKEKRIEIIERLKNHNKNA